MFKNNQEVEHEDDHRSVKYPVDPTEYRIVAEIGSGAKSVVYKALCLSIGSDPVAIKKSFDLDRHVAALGSKPKKISHPNILVEHCSFIVQCRSLWVVMPFMSAGSLASIVAAAFPSGLPEPAIAAVLRHTLAALSHLHRQVTNSF